VGKPVKNHGSSGKASHKSSQKRSSPAQPKSAESVPEQVTPDHSKAEEVQQNISADFNLWNAQQNVSENSSSEAARDDTWRQLLAQSWKELHDVEKGKGNKGTQEDSNDSRDEDKDAQVADKEPKSKLRFWQRSGDGSKSKSKSSEGEGNSTAAKGASSSNGTKFEVPQTFKEMCLLNANMLSVNLSYVKIVQECFERLVSAAANGDDARLELEVSIMALRMHREVEGTYQMRNFKLVMLASLRSLLPKSWSMGYEQAYIRMWDMVEEILTLSAPLPAKYEKAVSQVLPQMTDEDKKKFGLNAFNRLFDAVPKSEDFFNTSNSRLSVLATRALEMACEMYKDPMRVLNETFSLGLRHIMYNVPTDFFSHFVSSIVEELREFTTDLVAIEGVEWTLTTIGAIMVYTINEGSNPILRAVISNNAKEVRKALAPQARGNRAAACL